MRCPAGCEEGVTAVEDCACSCPTEVMNNATSYEVLVERTGIVSWLSQVVNGAITFDEASNKYVGHHHAPPHTIQHPPSTTPPLNLT